MVEHFVFDCQGDFLICYTNYVLTAIIIQSIILVILCKLVSNLRKTKSKLSEAQTEIEKLKAELSKLKLDEKSEDSKSKFNKNFEDLPLNQV